jgi:MFS family permease
MTDAAVMSGSGRGMTRDQRFVIVASSTGTVFEWYDFYLYATLAPFFAALFFPPGNDTAALLSAFATYAAGFLVRPFGAIVFGRVGDLVGRKYTFLVTIMVMGLATFAVGLLPTYATVGWLAPVLLVSLRLLQGLALGGEYGGAATYVAEHAQHGRRGYATSWIQTTATLGFFLSLVVIGLSRITLDAKTFADWGWRLPFLLSLVLLVFSVYIRLKLNESPVFQRMKQEGKGSRAPLTESFLHYPNNKYVLLALLGATAGQGVVWYTGQFYALFFLTGPLKLDFISAYALIALSLVIGTPLFLFFGWLSDRIGRLKIILAGCVIAALTYFPLFQALTTYVNPDLAAYSDKTKIAVAVDPAQCHFNIFVGPWSKFGDCDRAKDFLTKAGLSFDSERAAPGTKATLSPGRRRWSIRVIRCSRLRVRPSILTRLRPTNSPRCNRRVRRLTP